MIEYKSVFIVITCILVAIIFVIMVKRGKKYNKILGVKGRLIWMDKGKKTKPFQNRKYKVVGKPDFIFKKGRALTAIEYKSRRGKVYQSDIVQAKVASLAARGAGHKIRKMMVKTETDMKEEILPVKDKDLFEDVRVHIENVRKAAKGEGMTAIPNKYKCRSCAYNADCNRLYT